MKKSKLQHTLCHVYHTFRPLIDRNPVKLPFYLTSVFLATIACADPRDQASPGGDSTGLEAAVRDSADIRIIENPRPPAGSRLDWRVGAEPAVTIGSVDGEDPYLLSRVRGGFIVPDGRIVVVNGGSNELRVFDALGIHVATWGGSGEGPGEFTSLIQAHRWPGDSLIALYSQGRRLSVLDSEGNFGRAFALQRDDAFFLVEAVSPAGVILSSDLFLRGGLPEGLSRPEQHYRVRGTAGEFLASVGSFPGTEWFSSWSGTSGWGAEIPFAHRISTFAWGDLVAVAPSDSYEIRVFDLDGGLRRIVRRDHDLVVPTSVHIDATIERRVAELPEEERAERRQRFARKFPGNTPAGNFSRVWASADRCGGSPLGSGIRPSRGRGPQSGLDDLRSRGTCPGIRGNARRAEHLRNRRGPYTGPGHRRPRSGVRAGVVAGALAIAVRGQSWPSGRAGGYDCGLKAPDPSLEPNPSTHRSRESPMPPTFDMSLIQRGARLRRSPYFDATLAAGCRSYTVYNHMFLPTRYDDLHAEYERLLTGVTVWDVSVERQVEITGPDAFEFTNLLTPRDLTKCAVGQGKYVLITAGDGGIVNDPVLLRLGENHFWLALADSDVLLWAKGVALNSGLDVQICEPDVSPMQVQGPKSKEVVRRLFGDEVLALRYYWFLETELGRHPGGGDEDGVERGGRV